MSNKEVLFNIHVDMIEKADDQTEKLALLWKQIETHVHHSVIRFFVTRGASIPQNASLITEWMLFQIRSDKELSQKYETVFRSYVGSDDPFIREIEHDVSKYFTKFVESIGSVEWIKQTNTH